jgi:two-component SAPR family response regulator
MIKIAAVDDEFHVLERFERMVAEIDELELCGLFKTGDALMDYMKVHPLDAVFLDIEMPGVNGLELSEKVLNLNEDIDIIFVTAFNQYAIEAFELHALDYILKPLTEVRLDKTVRRLLKPHKSSMRSVKPFIQCIGDFEVLLGNEVLFWKNSKAKEILAFLVQNNGAPVTWEKIVDAVWPNYNAEKAHTNFHATTYLLRKRLSEAGITQILEGGRGKYRIKTDQVDCDLYQLEDKLKNKLIKRKEDFSLLEKLIQKGYMEASGYSWSYPKAAELDERCRRLISST